MKKLFFATVVLLAAFKGNAQTSSVRFSGGFNIGIPAHNLGGNSLGVGIDVMALYPLSEQVSVTGDFGYTALLAKKAKYPDATTTNLLPLRFGIRYYPSKSFFVAGKIGAGFISNSGNSITTTAYSFGLGYAITPKVELGGSYDGYSKNGSIGLVNFRIAYFFN